MARAYILLALTAFALFGAAQLSMGARVLLDEDEGDDCDEIRSMTSCMNKAKCAWCSNSRGARCVSAIAAPYVSYLNAGSCKGKNIRPSVKSKCEAFKTLNRCVDADDLDCAWCGGVNKPVKCLPEDAARFLNNWTKVCRFDDDDDDNDDNNNRSNNRDDDDDDDNDDNDDDGDDDDRK